MSAELRDQVFAAETTVSGPSLDVVRSAAQEHFELFYGGLDFVVSGLVAVVESGLNGVPGEWRARVRAEASACDAPSAPVVRKVSKWTGGPLRESIPVREFRVGDYALMGVLGKIKDLATLEKTDPLRALRLIAEIARDAVREASE